ncbi:MULTISPECIES: hypothetical protein [Campylobacter]|uniref:hypothetical protein n=1 Tax=Campylobacter TaxID=194 RepID=UPI00127D848A|nr:MULTISPECIES: hypothetical protein [Campylobacter]EAK0818740.1 hypothetical protein [Campylobacter lari]EAK9890335.1 hypothetical protein [Campylobacter lari]MBX1934908.1 hypothetical protein [Campylobacter lari]MCV3485804.1 hypothetical protein [Campylobacter sp. CNRCH_2014_2452]
MERPCLFKDFLKNCPFRVDEDEKITDFLFPIVDGMIQTCIENKQNLIIEGIYFTPKKLQKFQNYSDIKILFILFSKKYILQNYELIY